MIKKHLSFSSQKTMISSIVAISLTVALTAISFVPRGAHGEFDFQGLSDQVQDQQTQLNNHENRIKNVEDKTGTTTPEATPTSTGGSVISPSGSVSPSPSSPPSASPAPSPAAEPTWTWLPRQPIPGDPNHCMERKQWSDGHIEEYQVDRYGNTNGSLMVDRCSQ